jgi:2-polyprenyl-6-methoxyphenol hydroxylase-like FAD-dependent oxidoreductase
MVGELRRMDGAVIKHADFPIAAAFGGTFAIALRPALHGALLDAVGIENISVDHEAESFTQAGDRVTLRFRQREPVEGDLLIGADGMRSVIRRALNPAEPPPRPSRLVAVRGASHGATAHLHDLGGIYYIGPGVEAVLARASETGIYWFVSLAEELVPAGMTDAAAVLAHVAPRFDSTFRAITE